MWFINAHGGASLSLLSLLLLSVQTCLSASTNKKPNILYLFTDDQDKALGSMKYLPTVQSFFDKDGFQFNQNYATVALCCPSRAALLREQHAHNTNITDVSLPGGITGSYDKFRLSKQDESYLPQWLNKAGYRTEYIGKLMNGYGKHNYHFTPKGWDYFDGLLDPYTYIYNLPIFSLNGGWPVLYEKQHQTDVLRAKATSRLRELIKSHSDQPWFLEVAPVACHTDNGGGVKPPVPQTRYQNLYKDVKAPRTPNYNPKVINKPSWVGQMPLMDTEAIAHTDLSYRRRAEVLHGVDELFEAMIQVLKETGELDNTIVMFSSDHGYHLGQHRVPGGKKLPYKEDTLIPFMIRGPSITKGKTQLPSTHVDIAPTLLEIAGLPQSSWPEFLDGRDLSPYWTSSDAKALSPAPETINIEFWGDGKSDANIKGPQKSGYPTVFHNTYKTVRIVGDGYGYLYSHWCTGQTELYDTVTDPYELHPIKDQENLRNRLNGLVLVSKSCSTTSCRDPWKVLHPDGKVHTLKEAMQPEHDKFYANLPKVSFKKCLGYQLMENEAPYYPASSKVLGTDRRDKEATDHISPPKKVSGKVQEMGHYGAKYDGEEKVLASARKLTKKEMGQGKKRSEDETELGEGMWTSEVMMIEY